MAQKAARWWMTCNSNFFFRKDIYVAKSGALVDDL